MTSGNTAEIPEGVPLIRTIRDQRNITLFWIEHIMGAIMRLSERVRLLIQGLYRTLDQLGSDITMLLVEQNVEQALKHSKKAYIMETGNVVKSGLSKDLLQDAGIREAYLGL
jgi:ABC-type branched-subunit amino acid transport system ATPase component